MRHLAFLCGGRLFAVPLSQTVGIVPATTLRPVPGLRTAFRGLVPWNGTLVPVAAVFPEASAGQLVILSTRRGPLAIEVDGILGIYPDSAVERQIPAAPDSPHYLAGEVVIDRKSHALLDAEGVAEWACDG